MQWLIETYDCQCYNATERTICGGQRVTQFTCRGCFERGLAVLEQMAAYAERERGHRELVHQLMLGLKVDVVAEPSAPSAPGPLPDQP